jgi:hypothetical protein
MSRRQSSSDVEDERADADGILRAPAAGDPRPFDGREENELGGEDGLVTFHLISTERSPT